MKHETDRDATLKVQLATHGLRLFGELCTRLGEGEEHFRLLLVGDAGGEMWRVFSASSEAGDGRPHPLDRWTRRILETVMRETDAAGQGARVLFPFSGPPWHPFQSWARDAGCGRTSPLGILMHPRYGLWHGYRGAFAFPRDNERPETKPEDPAFACDSCPEKPCLNTCPVGAITRAGLDAKRCRAHILSSDGEECLTGGCLARRACPASVDWEQGRPQRAFHMVAFARGRELFAKE